MMTAFPAVFLIRWSQTAKTMRYQQFEISYSISNYDERNYNNTLKENVVHIVEA